MTKKQEKELLVSINKKLSKCNKNCKIILEKLEDRDDLLILITKELALLKNNINSKFENIEKELDIKKKEDL